VVLRLGGLAGVLDDTVVVGNVITEVDLNGHRLAAAGGVEGFAAVVVVRHVLLLLRGLVE
jgi:hypothetical protein